MLQEAKTLQHHVLVLAGPGEMSSEFERAGASVNHAGVLPGPSRRIVAVVRKAKKQFQPDGVIAWHGMVVLPEILHALHEFSGRVLVHGGNPAWTMPRWVDWRYLLREWRLGKRCDATYVCCSNYVANSFVRSRFLRRFPRVMVPNGVKPLTVPPHEPRAIASGEAFIIGMTSRLDGIKDHAMLLRAFALVVKVWPTARLELAGDGDLRQALEELAHELGIANKTQFVGTVRNVYAVMKNWDMFAYATTEREGLGNALTEAMMLGLPCVATNVGPIHEVAGVPPAILLVPPHHPAALAEAIGTMISDVNLRRKFAASARAYALQEFSAEVFARRYAEIFWPGQGKAASSI
jgi:glycosyltransferase involved in cell wall biosynthesis